MSNRLYTQFSYSLERKLVTLFGSIAIGATGAPTLNTKLSRGITSVVRNSAGNYTISLGSRYVALLFMDSIINLNSGAPSAGTNLNMVIRTDNSATATPTITIEFVNSSGSAVELANGCTLLISPQLRDSDAL